MEVWLKLYGSKEFKATKDSDLKVGSEVLISIDKSKFEKGFAQRFQSERFVIDHISDTFPRMYYLRSKEKGDLFTGGFYRRELTRVR